MQHHHAFLPPPRAAAAALEQLGNSSAAGALSLDRNPHEHVLPPQSAATSGLLLKQLDSPYADEARENRVFGQLPNGIEKHAASHFGSQNVFLLFFFDWE